MLGRTYLAYAPCPSGRPAKLIPPMPSLFRFLVSAGSLVAVISAGLYILAHQFEPEQHEVVKVVPGVKIRKPEATP
jgi:phosphoserine phosphatase